MIGEKLKKKLKEKGISNSEFAEMVGRNRNQVYAYLEATDINTKILREWSKILEVPMSYWFLENWEENQNQGKEIEALKKEITLLKKIVSLYEKEDNK